MLDDKNQSFTPHPTYTQTMMPEIERHPLRPFLPATTRLLMLGSFPPARKRWCMDFFYPNYTNDMWRIFGICFFADKLHFVDEEHKTFRQKDIEDFLVGQGIGIYDTATAVRRTKNTASDKDLEIVEPTDIAALLRTAPHCHAIVTTGQKATDVICNTFNITRPSVGNSTHFVFEEREMQLFKMPSSSRAYPIKVERKAEYYREMFESLFKKKDAAETKPS